MKTVTELNATEVREVMRTLNQALPTADDLKRKAAKYDHIGRAMQIAQASKSNPVRKAGRNLWWVLNLKQFADQHVIGVREYDNGKVCVKVLQDDGRTKEFKI
jgi:hypothetical protein